MQSDKDNLSSLDSFFLELKNLEFEKARRTLSDSNTVDANNLIYYSRVIERSNSSLSHAAGGIKENSPISELSRIMLILANGYSKGIKQETRPAALADFKSALELSISLGYKPLIKNSLLGILFVFEKGISQETYAFEPYLNQYKALIDDSADMFWYLNYKISLYDQTTSYKENYHENEDLYKELVKEIDSIDNLLPKNNRLKILINKIKGDYHVKYDGNLAEKYYKAAMSSIDISPYFSHLKFRLHIDLARANAIQGKYKEAINLIGESEKFVGQGNMLINKLNLHYFLSEYQGKLELYDSAYSSLKKVFVLERELNFSRQNDIIASLETELQTAEKEKQILLEQQKNRQNRNIAYGLGGLLLFGSLTFFLIQKNTKRKQLLAEQEKELQIQKVGTLMKEQELASIDAMIAGQEKERQRIANDLHDDLGGMMATVKLHFNTLKDRPSPELYQKTNKLLDEAYQKVRSIAHAKNSGVIARDGLLKSVKDMAQKVSATGKIHIEVMDHGLDNRLENSLELTIFRIIQELITNVIKHAEATEASIHLTQHDKSLNIMVEDNGKGFNSKQISKAKGMGLGSIDKRVDHLHGTMEIDSEMGRGTNIIIDIPI